MSRRCCCGRDCLVVSDNFDRANSDDPGPTWVEVGDTTDWDISSNAMVCVVEGPLITTVRQDRSVRFQHGVRAKYSVIVYARLINIGDPAVDPSLCDDFGVICGFRGPSDFDWVRLEYDSANNVLWPSFIRRTGGSDTVLADKSGYPANYPFTLDGTSFSLKVCYAENDWTVGTGTDEEGTSLQEYYSWTICGGGQDSLPEPFTNRGATVSLGMAGFLRGQYDEWALTVHWESLLDCPRCSCMCLHPSDDDEFTCFPEDLVATVVPLSGYNCPTLDYVQFPLKQGFYVSGSRVAAASKHRWTSGYVSADPFFSYPFAFKCGNQDGEMVLWFNVTYENMDDPGIGKFSYQLSIDWTESTCDPIYLVFKHIDGGAEPTCHIGENYGLQSIWCPDGDCLTDTSASSNYLTNDVIWKVVITE